MQNAPHYLMLALIAGMIFKAPLYYGIAITIPLTILLVKNSVENYRLWKSLR